MIRTLQALMLTTAVLTQACADNNDASSTATAESNLAFFASSACWEWAAAFYQALQEKLSDDMCKKDTKSSALVASPEVLVACRQVTEPGFLKIVLNRNLAITMRDKGCPNVEKIANAICLTRSPSLFQFTLPIGSFKFIFQKLIENTSGLTSDFSGDLNFLLTYFQGLCSRSANDKEFTFESQPSFSQPSS